MESTELKGTVKFFNADKGFGFITSEEKKEYFVHVSKLVGIGSLETGDMVTFDLVKNKKREGLMCGNVRLR